MWAIFKDEIDKLRKWLNNHKPIKYIALIIVCFIAVAGVYSVITGNPITSLFPELNGDSNESTPDSELKDYTLTLCQELTEFSANKKLDRPKKYDYSDNEEWLKAVNNYDTETLNAYKAFYSDRAENCYYEFEKRGLITNQYLIIDIISPGNVLVIDIIIEELSSLANQL